MNEIVISSIFHCCARFHKISRTLVRTEIKRERSCRFRRYYRFAYKHAECLRHATKRSRRVRASRYLFFHLSFSLPLALHLLSSFTSRAHPECRRLLLPRPMIRCPCSAYIICLRRAHCSFSSLLAQPGTTIASFLTRAYRRLSRSLLSSTARLAIYTVFVAP